MDRIGRKPTTIICSIGGCIGVIKIFLTNYYAYLAVEFLESLMASGLYTVAVILSKLFLCFNKKQCDILQICLLLPMTDKPDGRFFLFWVRGCSFVCFSVTFYTPHFFEILYKYSNSFQ